MANLQLPQKCDVATGDDVISEHVENQTDAIVVQQDENVHLNTNTYENVHFNSNPNNQNNDENGHNYIYETEDV